MVISASNRVQVGRELHLPSMALLTSKTSSQAFFLRILKVIVHLREATKLAPVKQQQRPTDTSESAPIAESGVVAASAPRKFLLSLNFVLLESS